MLGLSKLVSAEGIEHAVRIVAAADSETAWETIDDLGVSAALPPKP
jgi:hypothetical protein